MAKTARKAPIAVPPTDAATHDPFAAVAAGGPIAELQRTLEQRLLALSAISAEAVPVDAVHRLSRLAGPAALIAAYAATAIWLF